MDPVIPFLCIAASIFTIFISEKLAVYIKPRPANILCFCIALLILYPPARNTIQFNRLIAKKDNRLIATEWVHENLAAGSSVYQSGLPWGRLQIHPVAGECEGNHKHITVMANRNGKAFTVKINCITKQNIPGYEQWKYYKDMGIFIFENRITHALPQYIIVEESPLSLWSPSPPEDIGRLLRDSYYLQKSFKVVDCDNKENYYDQQDAFYVPFHGFKHVERPGSNIYIYEKKKGV